MTDAKQFTTMTTFSTVKNAPPAQISREVGGVFSLFGGHIVGRHIELVTDQLTWVLIGPEAARLHDGQRAKATGVSDPNQETTCTGSPLLISKADPA